MWYSAQQPRVHAVRGQPTPVVIRHANHCIAAIGQVDLDGPEALELVFGQLRATCSRIRAYSTLCSTITTGLLSISPTARQGCA